MTHAYDRKLIARMLESVAIGTVYGRDAVSEQIRLLREADNAEASPAEQVGEDGLPELPDPNTLSSSIGAPDFVYYTADRVRTYGARCRRLASGQGLKWQPIETASMEDVVVLFCDARGNRWTQTADCRVPVCGLPPIYWMPLPAAPTQEKGNG